MSEKKPAYICLYRDSWERLLEMSDASCGRVYRALMWYANDMEYEQIFKTKAERIVFGFLKAQVDRDFEKYRQKCEAGKKGGAPKGNKNAVKQKQAETTENNKDKEEENEEAKEYEKEKENEYVKEKKKENGARFNPSYDIDALSRFTPFTVSAKPHRHSAGSNVWNE